MRRFAVWVLLLWIAALAACTNSAQSNTVAPDSVVPNKVRRETMPMIAGVTSFQRFNGQYPSNWPAKLALPTGSYIDSRGIRESKLSGNTDAKVLHVKFIFKGSIDQATQEVFSHYVTDMAQLQERDLDDFTGKLHEVILPDPTGKLFKIRLQIDHGPALSNGWLLASLQVNE